MTYTEIKNLLAEMQGKRCPYKAGHPVCDTLCNNCWAVGMAEAKEESRYRGTVSHGYGRTYPDFEGMILERQEQAEFEEDA